ncbi:MAG: dihydropteroate synthase [Marinicaulis sp.]|nr:dihydropteroate synthase [Marinicaulis sp.]
MMESAPLIMGIVNVTPDSFSDGGALGDSQAAIDHALRLEDDGAAILDIGGESTRPGAESVSLDEERRRVLPVIEGLIGRTDALLSIDTRKVDIAKEAVAAGSAIWNDVSALSYDEASVETAASLDCEIVLMHAQGDPRVMQKQPEYVDVITEVKAYLAARVELCVVAGVKRERLIVDPGIGFGKTLDHNLALLANLNEFSSLDCRVLIGASRKRFIAALDRDEPAIDRVGGSIAAALSGARQGADIIRVHDVAATRQALAVTSAIDKA